MTGQPGEAQHGHVRPSAADQRAALGVYGVVLLGGNPEQAHEAAASGACPSCTAAAAAHFGITIAQELAGAGFVNGPLRPQLLAMIEATRRELVASAN